MIQPRVVCLVAAAFLTACASEPVSSQASRSTQEGRRLLHRMQDALGSADRIAAVRDLEETIRAEAYPRTG